MKKDADAHADQDKRARELVEARNAADAMIYTAEKALTDHKDNVADDVKTSVQASIDALKKAKEGSDLGAIQSASQALSTEMQKIGSAMNQQSGTQTPPPEAGPEPRDVDSK